MTCWIELKCDSVDLCRWILHYLPVGVHIFMMFIYKLFQSKKCLQIFLSLCVNHVELLCKLVFLINTEKREKSNMFN